MVVDDYNPTGSKRHTLSLVVKGQSTEVIDVYRLLGEITSIILITSAGTFDRVCLLQAVPYPCHRGDLMPV